MKGHLSRVLSVAVALAFVAPQLSAIDCRTAFASLKSSDRRQKAIECAKNQYAKEIRDAEAAYLAALRRTNTVYQDAQKGEAGEKAGSAVHRVAVEAAVAAHKKAKEVAREKRNETLRLNTKHGVFNYGVGVATVVPHGERRIIDARLDVKNVVQPVAYAQEEVRPFAVVSYFPRDLTWGTGNRRWGLGPMVIFDHNGPWDNLGLGAMIGVSRSGDSEGPVSLGLGVAYYLDNNSRMLREDFVPRERTPRDGSGDFLQPMFVETTGHFFTAVITISFWDRPGS